jgi:hypothetical protein
VDATREDPSTDSQFSDNRCNHGSCRKHVLVIADSCYSGKTDANVKIQEKTSAALETGRKKGSSGYVFRSLEPVTDTGVGDHSVFAAALIAALMKTRGILDGTRF